MINNVFRVDGDSMKDVGLHDGLFVEVKQKEVSIGDIVVVRIDGKIFIKQYDISDGKVIFRSRNKNYEDIYFFLEYEILGVVTWIFS